MSLFWLLLLLIGVFTYIVVQRNVSSITRTPVWLLWLVMMMPAFIWMGWILINGESEPMPTVLLIAPFLVCPILYWLLIQWGRPTEAAQKQALEASSSTPPADVAKAKLRPITKTEETALQNCFPWSVYYLQKIEYQPKALVCRGKLRTSPEKAYETIRENVQSEFGDRFLVLLQEGINGKPFFALISNPDDGKAQVPQQLSRPGVAIGLLLATLLTTTLAGSVQVTGATDSQFPQTFAALLTGLPYALSLLAILGTHEMGHYVATRLHRIRSTLPYFIPVPPAGIFPFGTFGAFIQMRSPVPNRKALFDVGIAGPFAGFVVTIPLLIWGLAHSQVTTLSDESSILNFESFKPTASLMLALLSKLALGSTLTADSGLVLHPVAIAGCLGLVVTALNLMPVGQLDGGHIVHAMFGQRTGAAIGQIARLLVLLLSFVQREFLIWAILLFFIPAVDEPALNDVSELDNVRDFSGLLALALLVAIVLPAPAVLMQLLF